MKKTATTAAILWGITLGGIAYLEFAAVKPAPPAKAQHKATRIELRTKESGPVEMEEEPEQSIVIKAVKSRADRIAAGMDITDKRFRKNYTNIFAQLGLTDTEIDAVVNELDTRQVMIDMVLGQLSAKYSYRVDLVLSDKESATIVATAGSAAIWNQIQAQVTGPMEENLRGILGDKYPAFHNFEVLQPYQTAVDDFNSNLPDGSKLTNEQSQQLLTEISTANASGQPNTPYEYLRSDVLASASNYLSSTQLRVLQSISDKNSMTLVALSKKLNALEQSGWKGNPISDPLLISDPFK